MSYVALARPSKTVAVTVIGALTLFLGGYCAAFGGWAIFAGADWFAHPSKEPLVQVIALGGIVSALIIVFGAVFLLLGILALLAGLGVLWRKQWGRILAFIVAAVAILLGLVWVGGSDQEVFDIAVGAVQILYGILAFVVLIMNGVEFSRPQV
jgi:hypothetical protein